MKFGSQQLHLRYTNTELVKNQGITVTERQYDLVVIGSGPAGESAAISAAKHNQRVVVIEENRAIGGWCTHRGTIPSKALRHMVSQVMRIRQTPIQRDELSVASLSYQELLSHAEDVMRKQVEMRSNFYRKNRVPVIPGRAVLIDKNTVEVTDRGNTTRITANSIVIATGSSPYRPEDMNFNHPRVYDSDTILDMKHTPRKIVIFGAGVIGSEYASIFAGIGVKVELINTRPSLMEFLDDEISDALSYQLRDMGVMVRHSEQYDRLETSDHSVSLYLKSGKVVKADAILWCNGRSGNTENLGLEEIGVQMNERGQIMVDERYQTSIESIYAAGDVVGWPSLASAAYDQGRSAAAAIRGKESVRFVDNVPTGIYTIPEISSIGATEKDLTSNRIPYEVGRAFFKDTARGQITGESVGVLKILFHAETLEIMGIHCFGAEASEIIHIGQAIMSQPGELNTIKYFTQTTFNYPTMAEAYRVAALNGLNRISKTGR